MFGGDTTAPPSDDPLYYAAIFKKHNLTGGHVFIHGPGGEEVTKKVLELWPQGFAVAGDVTDATGPNWLKLGASKVIVRSWLFPDGKFNEERLRSLSALVGSDKLIVDVSCRRIPPKEGSSEPRWKVALNSWKTLTDTEVNEDSILVLSSFVSELLVHPADENGKQMQIDEELVRKLAKWATVPVSECFRRRGRAWSLATDAEPFLFQPMPEAPETPRISWLLIARPTDPLTSLSALLWTFMVVKVSLWSKFSSGMQNTAKRSCSTNCRQLDLKASKNPSLNKIRKNKLVET